MDAGWSEDRIMKKISIVFALAASLALSGVAAGAGKRSGGKQIQKWVDKDGVVHYGDAPPPEAIQNGRTVLNAQGVVVRQIPAQMTPEEAAAARKQQEEEARRRSQDSFLLTTYTRVGDIERVRDEQIALIDSQIDLARGSLASSEQRMKSVETRMAGFRPYSNTQNARRLPDKLAAEAVHALGERRSMQETLAKHEQRREETRAKFNADIARYQELVSRPSIR
jgi:hypothetical protein